jgi:chromosome segregation ATPase
MGRADSERLTKVATAAEAETATARQQREELQTRLSKAEASIEATHADLETTRAEIARALDSERRARDEAAEVRGQLKALGNRTGK